MKRLQYEHKQWIASMYPNQPPELPAAGMVEEAGELLHVAIAMRRAQLWGDEPRYPPEKLASDFIDAVGDCGIYVCSYCNSREWNFHGFTDTAPVDEAGRSMVHLCVDIVRIASTFYVEPHTDYLRLYIGTLKAVCSTTDLDFEEVVRSTWETVKRRKRA